MKRILGYLRPAVHQGPLSSTVVGSYPQPDWLIDREALGSHSVPRVRASHAWRIPEPNARGGAGRRHAGGHPRHGARRDRHDHRRGDPPGELLEPVRHRARGRRRRPPRHDPHPRRRARAGAAHRRARCAGAPRSRCATSSSCAPTPTGRSRSPCPGRSRWPSRRSNEAYDDDRRAGHGPGRRGQRRSPRARARRRRRDPARRAVATQRPRGSARGSRYRRSTARLQGLTVTTGGAPVLRLCRADGRQDRQPLRLPWRAERQHRRPDLGRGGPAPARPGPARGPRPKIVVLGVLDLGDPQVESPQTVAERIRAALDPRARRATRRCAGLRHEVPPAGAARSPSSRRSAPARRAFAPSCKSPGVGLIRAGRLGILNNRHRGS